LQVRHRSRRYRLRPAHEDALAARLRHRPTKTGLGREHPHPIPTPPRPRSRRHHEPGPGQSPWQAVAKTLCQKVRAHLFTFLEHPEVAPDNNGSERELRPTATYRKVTGGFRSDWGADLFAAVKSVIGTAARTGIDAYAAILNTLRGQSVLQVG